MSVCKAFYAPVDITGAFLGPEYCLLQSRNYFLQEELKMSNYLSMLSDLWKNIRSNVVFLLQFIGIIAFIILVAYLAERIIHRKNPVKEKVLSTRKIAVIGIMSALASVLMLFEFPLPFVPPFYKLDFSELPILLCGFAYGPVAGVVTEAVKILLNFIIDGTTTAFVGELANFVVGSVFILTATIIYHVKKSKKTAIIGCICATLVLTIVGSAFNGIYLLPKFSELYGMPLDAIIGMGTQVNPSVKGISTFLLMGVAALNLIRGTAVSIITILLYRPLRPLLKKNI